MSEYKYYGELILADGTSLIDYVREIDGRIESGQEVAESEIKNRLSSVVIARPGDPAIERGLNKT